MLGLRLASTVLTFALALPAFAAEVVPGKPTYPFARGFPTPAGAQSALDDADLQRAMIAYRFWYPTVSVECIFEGNRRAGIQDNVSMPILSAAPRHTVFTANSDTPYGGGAIDLKDGPMVVELPAGPFIATANDHHQEWIMDMGLPGPDAGKGGKHVVLPPGWKDAPPEGHHVGRSRTLKVLLAIRALPENGDVKAAMDALRSIKIYPLSTASAPKPLEYVDVTLKRINMTPLGLEESLDFWRKLHQVIDSEPLVETFRPMYGLLATLGIEKGKPLELNSPSPPIKRMKAILQQAARDGRDQMLVSAFDSTRPDRRAWEDHFWEWVGLVADNGNFETPSGIDLEARDRWFVQAILTSPAMFRRTPGAGSLYWVGLRDAVGEYLDGGKTYKLTVPLPVPAKLFWSVTVYDAATRSQIVTRQEKAALRSLFELKDTGGAKSVDLYFGPKAPKGQEARWIQTTPDKGWFAYFRIYGPDEKAFDGTWWLNDFEPIAE
jgi:hypothetical protein